jgi:hypothetical protein
MNWLDILVIVGSAASSVGLIYMIVRNFRRDFKEQIEKQDDRIFLLATGKSLADAIREAHEKGKLT